MAELEQSRAQCSIVPTDDGAIRVRLAGELDMASLTELQPELDDLLSRKPQPAVFDLTDVTFMDSSGVAVLIRLANHFGEVQVAGVDPGVRRVIEVLGLAERLGLAGA